MVSFSCESCNETLIKKKVAAHLGRCRAPVSCIDCCKTFPGQTFKDHNQCMTENEKYQGKLYKPKPSAKAPGASKETPEKISKKSEPAKAPKTQHIKIEKEITMRKLLKKLRSEHNLDKKAILEKLTIDSSGLLYLK